MSSRSIAFVPEEELVELLYSNLFLFDTIAIPPDSPRPFQYRLRVKPEQLQLPKSAFGDVDSLLLPQAEPTTPLAIQYKRVKITANTFRTGRPNRLRELMKAVHQVNALVRAGFSVVWLSVIVVTDVRELTGGQFHLFSGLLALPGVVESAIPLSDLHESVGVLVTEVVQSVDRPVTETGQMGNRLLRRAVPRPQSSSLTDAVARFFA